MLEISSEKEIIFDNGKNWVLADWKRKLWRRGGYIFTADFKASFKLHNFPFDVQHLELLFGIKWGQFQIALFALLSPFY